MYQSIPFVIIGAVLLWAFVLVSFLRHRILRRGLRHPFTQKIERAPGQGLLKRLDALNEEIGIQTTSMLVVPLAIYAAHLSYLYFENRPFQRIEAIAVGAVAIAYLGYALYRLSRLLEERRRIRLGCEGEMIVGQALNLLMLKGYRVYHDFPADSFNIDHIVVGARGVFAVETKTRSKRTTASRQEDATVAYDGRALHFPSGTDVEMIAQAKRQSKWLADWLSRAVGEPISVRAILALPGWFVKRTAPEGLPVVNPKQFDSLFEHIPPRPLTTSTITRIAHQLDRKCRDVSPHASPSDASTVQASNR